MKKQKFQKIHIILVLIFFITAITAFMFILNSFFCRHIKEISSFTAGRDSVYYYGTRVCPASWRLNPMSKNEIKTLTQSGDIAIVSKNDPEELEREISSRFLDYSKFLIENNDVRFVVYEIDCQICR